MIRKDELVASIIIIVIVIILTSIAFRYLRHLNHELEERFDELSKPFKEDKNNDKH